MLAAGVVRRPAPFPGTASEGDACTHGQQSCLPQVSNSSRFGVTRRREDDAVVLAVSGAVDEVTAPSLATDLDVVLMGEPALLVIDLTAVEFMSSAGMNLLIETQRLTASTATTVRVAADGTATSRPMRFI